MLELLFNHVLPTLHSFTAPRAAPSTRESMAEPEVAVAVFVLAAHKEYATDENPEDDLLVEC